jgi:GT2 family glycosyltransferase
MKIKISILIVNYNTEQYIENLLSDLSQQSLSPAQFEVIITNNVQNDKLRLMIKRCQINDILNIKIIPSQKNIGFGQAMNLAAQHAQGQHLLISNPDLRINQLNFLEKLINNTEQYQDYGVISAKILSDKAGYKTEYHHYEFKHSLGYDNQVCWLSGALLLIRANIFQRVSGFDPDFFMYCEDEDLCYRIKQLNLALISLPDLEVYHLGGASEPLQDYAFYYRWYRSRLLFAHKHFSKQEFAQLLPQLRRQAQNKLRKYKLLYLFYFKSYGNKTAKWQVMQDIVEKIRREGTDWLYFKAE